MDEKNLLGSLSELARAVHALRQLLPNPSQDIEHQLVVIFTILHGVQIESSLEQMQVCPRLKN